MTGSYARTHATIVWPWLWALVVLAVLGAGFAAWRYAKHRKRGVLWVANTAYLPQVPAIAAWLRRYKLLRATAVGAVLITAVAAGAVAARPADKSVVVDKLGTRDIVLCLDVSGSMIEYDGAVLNVFDQLVDNFRGERIALSVFNSTSRTVFPLTDDYPLVHEELDAGIKALDRDPSLLDPFDDRDAKDILEFTQFVAGTMSSSEGSSLIGDGLANCAMQFDEADTKRSRSIILATDNFVSGLPIYTLGQAADLVSARDITLHGIFGAPQMFQDSPEEEEFRRTVQSHGGMYFQTSDPSLVEDIVDDVVAQQAIELGSRPQVVIIDRPQWWYFVALAGVAILVLVGWRVRE